MLSCAWYNKSGTITTSLNLFLNDLRQWCSMSVPHSARAFSRIILSRLPSSAAAKSFAPTCQWNRSFRYSYHKIQVRRQNLGLLACASQSLHVRHGLLKVAFGWMKHPCKWWYSEHQLWYGASCRCDHQWFSTNTYFNSWFCHHFLSDYSLFLPSFCLVLCYNNHDVMNPKTQGAKENGVSRNKHGRSVHMCASTKICLYIHLLHIN